MIDDENAAGRETPGTEVQEEGTASPSEGSQEPVAPQMPGETSEAAASPGSTETGQQERDWREAGEIEIAAQEQKPVAASAAPQKEPPVVHQGAARPIDPVDADDVLDRRMPGHEAGDAAVLAASRKHTRRSFAVAAASLAAGLGFYKYLDLEQHQDEVQPTLLRRVWQFNAALTRAVVRDRALTPTYPLSRAETLRVNGLYGVKRALVPESWRLQFVGVRGANGRPRYVEDVTAWEYRYTDSATHEDPGHDSKIDPKASAQKMAPASEMGQAQEDENHTGRKPRGTGEAGESDSTLPPGTPGLLLTMRDIHEFPRHELVTQFKCIEGWSQIVHWAGIRLADLLEAYPPALVDGREPKYVYMETPDGDYYNGYDLEACRHPQALLVTEMMGAPLTQLHGAPLRLHMPTKYGYKQIKRIGLISYTSDKPDDYWTKLGYDWYGGL